MDGIVVRSPLTIHWRLTVPEAVPGLPVWPIVFMFQPTTFEVVTGDRLLRWEQLMKEKVGLNASIGNLIGSATISYLAPGVEGDGDIGSDVPVSAGVFPSSSDYRSRWQSLELLAKSAIKQTFRYEADSLWCLTEF